MGDRAYEEARANRHMLSWLCGIVRDLCEDVVPAVDGRKLLEQLDEAMKKWHEYRFKRFNQQIQEAEEVLEKATNMSDYGYPGSSDKFVPQSVIESLLKRIETVEHGLSGPSKQNHSD